MVWWITSIKIDPGAACGVSENEARRNSGMAEMRNTDVIQTELLEIEGILLDDRPKDEDRHALHGAQQSLRWMLEPDAWLPALQTFGARPDEAAIQ